MVKVNESKPEDGPQSYSSIDDSFVVLERTSQESNDEFASHMLQQPPVCPAVPPHGNYTGGLPRMEGQSSQNSSYVPDITTDLSPEEIQKRLHELLQENLELRETLQQNNLAMKQQFNTLAMWQEEVFKVHQNHKAKFAETKELVLKLRAENSELKNILEDCKKTGSGIPGASETKLMMENVELKGIIAELQQKLSTPAPRKEQLHSGPPSKKEQELSALLEQVNRQLETAERARRQLTMEVEHLTAQRIRLERDMAVQKNELEEQKEELTKSRKEKEELEQKITLLMEQHQQEIHAYAMEDHLVVSSPPLDLQQPYTQNFQRLTFQLDDQLAVVNSLTHELKKERTKMGAGTAAVKGTPAIVNEQASRVHDLKGCEKTLEHVSSSLDKESQRLDSLDSWLLMTSDTVDHWRVNRCVEEKTVNTLKAHIQQVRTLLIQDKSFNEEKKKYLDEAQDKLRQLCSDYQVVIRELQNFHEEQRNMDHRHNAYLEVQARGFTEKIDSLTAQLLSKEEALTQKETEVALLKEKVEKCELQKEAVTILKAQVEVYQSDFNAEREARQNLAGEKERLAEDLRHLQHRNQQLLDELEAYQLNHFEQLQKQAPPATVVSAPVITSGWNTIATPGRSEPQRAARSSPGRPSSGPQQQHPLPPTEEDDQPFKVYDEEVPPPKRYFCPVCNMEFAQVSLLEYHVDTCLE